MASIFRALELRRLWAIMARLSSLLRQAAALSIIPSMVSFPISNTAPSSSVFQRRPSQISHFFQGAQYLRSSPQSSSIIRALKKSE